MASISQIKLPNNAKYNINVPLVEGTGTTAGTWLGTLDGLTEYYDGLMIRYKINIAGASTTTLNLNSLGAKTCYMYGTTKLTTHYPIDSIILLIYSADQNNGCWTCVSNYWKNTTYSTMSVSELTTGTATSARSVRADYLKQGIEDIVGENSVELTQAEYNALPSSKLTDGVNYFITDAPGDAGNIIHATEVTYDNSESKLSSGNVQGAIDEIDAYISDISDLLALSSATVSITSSYVTSGDARCYKKGGTLAIKVNGLKFSSFTGRITIGKAPEGFRPPFESTGMFDATTTVFGITSSGDLWVDAGASGKQVWGMITTILA